MNDQTPSLSAMEVVRSVLPLGTDPMWDATATAIVRELDAARLLYDLAAPTVRSVATTEDLYALPAGTIVRDTGGHVYEKDGAGAWFTTGTDFKYGAGTLLDWGVSVIYRPDIRDRQEGVAALLAANDALVAEVAKLRHDEYMADASAHACLDEWRTFVTDLGLYDGYGPIPSPPTIAEIVKDWEQDFRDHAECPHLCEGCGEWLATVLCPGCGGSGRADSIMGASECGPCGGAGWLHEGCASLSYADLVERVRETRAEWGRRIKDDSLGSGHLIGHVSSLWRTEAEARDSMECDQEIVRREVTEWRLAD